VTKEAKLGQGYADKLRELYQEIQRRIGDDVSDEDVEELFLAWILF
jgi:hypothetical protein